MALGRTAGAHSRKTNHDAAVDSSYHFDPLNGLEHHSEHTKGGDRKRSRVGAPILQADADVESAVSVGKQLQLEAENQIKYRTCSWQKVN